jgi:hypothetical protein
MNLDIIIGGLPIRDWLAVRMTHLGSLTRGSAKINRPSSLLTFVAPTRGN